MFGQPWVDDAACVEHPEADFFPAGGVPTPEVVAICASCLVRVECLAWAIEHHVTDGIWGGASARERAQLGRAWAA